jgi:hypothetical protein
MTDIVIKGVKSHSFAKLASFELSSSHIDFRILKYNTKHINAPASRKVRWGFYLHQGTGKLDW